MNKVCGNGANFALVKQERSRTIVCYELKHIQGSELSEWYEVYFPRKVVDLPNIEQIRKAVEDDINAQTDEKILTGFVWTPQDGSHINVYLSMENQNNYSEAYHIAERRPEAILPVTFKLGEMEDKTPIYHTFETFAELESFYLQGAAYKQACLAEGWQRKDAIDWEPYQEALDELLPNE